MKSTKFSHPGFKYTTDQETALDKMIDWSHTKVPLYTLSGAAGTGKTTVLKEFIKQNKFNTGVAVTAPTHKAVRIASQLSGLAGVTIQKLLGLRPNMNVDDFDINNPRFDPKARKAIKDHSLVIVDEASMINKDLFGLISSEAIANDVKILFVGDPYQLPPVNETISPVFTTVKERFSLEEIVRQEDGNPLLKLLSIIRNDVKYNSFKFIEYIHRHPVVFSDDGKGYISASKEDFRNFMINAFASDNYSKNIDYCKYCAYTNENVLAWNSFIRSSMHKNEASKIIIRDDLITAYGTLLDEFQSQIIVNSEDYIIDDIQKYRNQSNIDGYIVRFRKVFGGDYTPYMFIVDTAEESNTLKFLGIINNYIREAYNAPASQRGRKWESFYKFKDNHLLIRSLFTDQGRIIVKKDIDYGYCLTVHKTQGSTYEHIFVNARNMIYNKYGRPYADQKLRNKLLYVSLSRATNSATILM